MTDEKNKYERMRRTFDALRSQVTERGRWVWTTPKREDPAAWGSPQQTKPIDHTLVED